jgi:hypothetical protein
MSDTCGLQGCRSEGWTESGTLGYHPAIGWGPFDSQR